jgi:hypothetical protein
MIGISSTRIYAKEETPTDEALAHVIRNAHSLGLKVLLSPRLQLDDKDTPFGMLSFVHFNTL